MSVTQKMCSLLRLYYAQWRKTTNVKLTLHCNVTTTVSQVSVSSNMLQF